MNRELLCAGFGWKPGSRMPTQVYNKLRPQDYLETLLNSKTKQKRDIQICPQCGKENPTDKNFYVWCAHILKESLMIDAFKQFRADQKAQEELDTLRKKNEILTDRLDEIEGVLSAMKKVPVINKILNESVELSKE